MSGGSNLSGGFRHTLSSTFSFVRDKVTKVPTVSKFEEQRVSRHKVKDKVLEKCLRD